MSICPVLLFSFAAFPGTGAAGAAAAGAPVPHQPDDGARRRQGQEPHDQPIQKLHSRLPICHTAKPRAQATEHCSTMTPKVAQTDRSSRLMAATAATQGV